MVKNAGLGRIKLGSLVRSRVNGGGRGLWILGIVSQLNPIGSVEVFWASGKHHEDMGVVIPGEWEVVLK